jgi:ABC-2 type transport system ATP-binding protein
MTAIEVRDLRKTYDGSSVLNGVSFNVEPGEIFALLGPNGAGKSTTIEILEGHRKRTGGRVSVLGCDPETASPAFLDRVGIVLQESGIEDQLTVREAIDVYGSTYSRRRHTDELLDLVDLGNQANSRVKSLSGGQRRRIDLALGIVGDPDVLFLDEPTIGFDAEARRRSWDLIHSLRDRGTAIMLTTHYMDEVEHLADRVAVMVTGSIVAEGDPQNLIDSIGVTRIRFRLPLTHSLADLPAVGAFVVGDEYVVAAADPTALLHVLTSWAVGEGIVLGDLNVSRPSLEDAYLVLAAGAEASEVTLESR